MKDSELLTYIKKLIEQKTETLQGKDAWQEHLDRHTTVSAKSLQASEIISGFSGSWASVYGSLPSELQKEKIPILLQFLVAQISQKIMIKN